MKSPLGCRAPALAAYGLVVLLLPRLGAQHQVWVPDTVGTGVFKQKGLAGEPLDIPMPPKGMFQLPGHHDVPIPIGTGTLPQPDDAPSVDVDPNQRPVTGTGAFTYFVNRVINTTGSTSVVAEPSAAVTRDTAFATGNWYGAVSGDSGMTWTYVNPYTRFPAIDGGFCCDQRTIYVPAHDITLWLLQYSASATQGTYRIAVCQGRADLLNSNATTNPWYYYDYQPQDMGRPAGEWFDFPDIAVTADNLHVSANSYNQASAFQQSIRWRISLADLAAGAASPNWSYNAALTGFNFRFCQGSSGGFMYFGVIESTTSLRVYTYDEAAASTANVVRTIAAFTNTTASAPGPDARDWAGRCVGRIRGAYATSTELGFLVPSDTNGGSRPMPYTRVSRFRTSDRTLIGDTDIWSGSTAYLYGAAYGNASGDVGCVIAVGGGTSYPHVSAFIVDTYAASFGGQTTFAMSGGTHGPDQNRWGDYYSLQIHPNYPRTWIGTGAAQNGGPGNSFNEPRYAWFGRNDFEPTWITLNVQSTPVSGISITQTETDLNGAKNGVTPYTRRFQPSVRYTLTAPATFVSGATTYQFDRWAYQVAPSGTFVLEPVDQRTLAQDTIGGSDDTAEARYLARRTLTVQSTNPASGVPITVSLADVGGLQNGTTSFSRTYKQTYTVTLTAPALSGANPFKRWRLNGANQPLGQQALNVTFGAANVTAIADYYIHTNGAVSSFGTGCAYSNGLDVHTVTGTPEIGQVVNWNLTGGRALTSAIPVLGFSRTVWFGVPLPLPLVSAPGCSINISVDITYATVTNAAGQATFPVPIPNDVSLINGHVFTQYWCLDLGANAANLTFSNGVDMRMGGNQ